ncbi:MAG: DUF2298 domain-containing protein [Anaerolineales bacterium]
MLDFIAWYVIVLGLGWLVFPLSFRLLVDLPGRGLAFTKILGMMIWGYLFWILSRLGFTANDLAGLIFPLLLIAGASLYSLRGSGWRKLKEWLREHRSLVFTTEALFLAAFIAMALVRALNPEIVGTEKPMELAFINAILSSEGMPPRDPWLSGYAISYYYFGYILVAMLAKLAGTLGSVAFNLAVSLTFALAALGSYGVLYNLLALRKAKWQAVLVPGLLAPFFTLIVSNWEGFLHYLSSEGLFWNGTGGQSSSPFWSWLDIQDLVNPPAGNTFGHWWWWRASRVIQDYDFSGFGKEVISEFPFFSFLLGDLHPHVLSIPYVFLILVFAIALYLRPRERSFSWLRLLPLEISPAFFLVLAWLAGGMAFLNTWNFPMYVGILAGAYALRENQGRKKWDVIVLLKDFLFLGAALGVTGGFLYLPWYLGFSSQAGGILPNVLFITYGNQFWVMFGPLLVPIFAWLIVRYVKERQTFNLALGLRITAFLVVGLLLLMLAYVGLAALLNITSSQGNLIDLFLGLVGGTDPSQVVLEGLFRRLQRPGTWLTLSVLSLLGWGLIFPEKEDPSGSGGTGPRTREIDLILLLVLSGMVLVLFPEFIYLRDMFGYRINTIFKFYYQAWLIWSIAAAYAFVVLSESLKGSWRLLVYGAMLISLGMALFYPVLGLNSKTNGFTRAEGLSLDGSYLYPSSDYEGVSFLRNAEPGVIAEAVGGSYSTEHARMATYTGYPTILGWDFHEVQWRGGWDLVMLRKEDVATLYCTTQWETARSLLEKYQVSYVVVGNIEYSTYTEGSDYCPFGIKVDKFDVYLQPAFRNERLTIYSVPEFQQE